MVENRRNTLYIALARRLRAGLVRTFASPPTGLGSVDPVGLRPCAELWGPCGVELEVADRLPRSLFGARDRLLLALLCAALRRLPNHLRETREGLEELDAGLVRAIPTAPPVTRWVDAATDRGWARLATHGPIASATTREGEALLIDLSVLRGLATHPGLEPLGAVVALEFSQGRAQPRWIELADGRRWRPGEGGWARARLVAGCTMHTWLVVYRHLAQVHYMASGAMATAVQNHLPRTHPLRPLLEPHLAGALAVNHRANHTLVGPSGAIQASYNLTYEGGAALIGRAVTDFRWELFDLPESLGSRGLTAWTDAGWLPAMEDARDLWAAIDAYVAAYIAIDYPTDAAVAGDVMLQRCLGALAGLLPRPPEVATIAGLRRLITRMIVAVTVEHQLVGGTAWDFMTRPDTLPHRVYCGLTVADSLPSLEECVANLTAKWVTSARGYRLVAEWSQLAHDDRGRAVIRGFQRALEAVGAAIDARNHGPQRTREIPFEHLHPRHLDSSAAT